MANRQISGLNADTTPARTDVLPKQDAAGAIEAEKSTIAQILGLATVADLSDGQDLAVIEALNANGFPVRIGTNQWALRTLTAGTNVTVTNGDGVAGNPSIASTGGGGVGADLTAIEALSGTGIAVRTGTDAWAQRTLVAGTNVTITNPDGVSGNITIAATGTGGGLTSPVGIVDGGTGQITAYAGHDALTVKAADLASAATTSIGAALGIYVNVTGVTTITSFGAGTPILVRIVTFTGILTLTHHATNLILPTAAPITTAPGDMAIAVCYATNAWRVFYQRASGLALGADLSIDATSAANGDILKRVGGAPVWADDVSGFSISVAAPTGDFLAATGSITILGPPEAFTLSNVRRVSVAGTCSIQIYEAGAAINGFGSPVAVTTTAGDTASTEAIAANALLRLDWSSGGAALTGIAVTARGFKT